MASRNIWFQGHLRQVGVAHIKLRRAVRAVPVSQAEFYSLIVVMLLLLTAGSILIAVAMLGSA